MLCKWSLRILILKFIWSRCTLALRFKHSTSLRYRIFPNNFKISQRISCLIGYLCLLLEDFECLIWDSFRDLSIRITTGKSRRCIAWLNHMCCYMERLSKEDMGMVQIVVWKVRYLMGCSFSSVLLSCLQTIRNLSLMPLFISLIQ